MYIAAATTSMRFEVSAPMRVENCIGSTCTENPASLPIAVMMSTITPWIVFDCVSRKVKGIPVGVEPTLTVCCASAGAAKPMARPAAAKAKSFRNAIMVLPVRGCRSRRRLPLLRPSLAGREALNAVAIGDAPAPVAFSAPIGEIVGDGGEIGVGDLLDHLGHRRIVAASLAGFVLAQRPLEIILPLRADARDLVVPRQVGIVAEAAAMARRCGTPLLDPGRLGTDGGRDRRRQLRQLVRESPQVIVGEVLRELVHRLRDALLLAKDVELDEQERRRLAPDRGTLGGPRRTLPAMEAEPGPGRPASGSGRAAPCGSEGNARARSNGG